MWRSRNFFLTQDASFVWMVNFMWSLFVLPDTRWALQVQKRKQDNSDFQRTTACVTYYCYMYPYRSNLPLGTRQPMQDTGEEFLQLPLERYFNSNNRIDYCDSITNGTLRSLSIFPTTQKKTVLSDDILSVANSGSKNWTQENICGHELAQKSDRFIREGCRKRNMKKMEKK